MPEEKIIYTKVDEAPALATYSFFPVIKAFASKTGVKFEMRDISLAGRIIAAFPDYLDEEQRQSDDLAYLGELVKRPEANVIKLPCISASIPQIMEAVKELQEKGYGIPDYPEEPKNDEEREIRARFDRIKGSAVNPVLREGNSDRRVPTPVKNFARKNPPPVKDWPDDSRSHVATMKSGDLMHNEKSVTLSPEDAGDARIELVTDAGDVVVLKERMPLLPGEVFDGSFMDVQELRKFLSEEVDDALRKDVLFSVHLKATMMKVSDPIIFGHVVSTYFREVFEKHAETFARLGVDPNNGLGVLYERIKDLPEEKRKEIERDIEACYEKRPKLAMVDSDRGITNLHMPNLVIIDASMPAAIKTGGQMWGPDGKPHDTKFVIPDSSYSGVYDVVVEDCKRNGAFDPKTIGTIPNVGLMAKKAEEYGSHDKTFEIPEDGTVRVVAASGKVLMEHSVKKGDIWRGCQTKDDAIKDWVKLAVSRARETGWPTVFWLDRGRAHDAELLKKLDMYLPEHDSDGLDIRVMSPVEATKFSVERMRRGENTISVTGNVLRDYLTDLFPIIEVGTSARMLSIVPLMNGGGLFETGAGGSAPKHVQQFLKEGHLRWDSLGEFLAIPVSLKHYARRTGNERASVLADALDRATEKYLFNNRSPSRKVHELDTRGSQFYLTMYWARAMAEQEKDRELADEFSPLADALEENVERILEEMNATQGRPQDVGGYYKPDDELASAAMRPSRTLNSLIDSF